MKLEDLVLNGNNHVEILPPDPERMKENAEFYQADDQTTFGMLIHHSGGVTVNGVVRLLGSTADPEYRDIKAFNEQFGGNGFVILGDDIFGGIFALNLGLLPECPGNIIYFAPDTMEFEDLGLKLSGLFEFLRNGDLSEFYGQFSPEEYENLRAVNVKFNEVLHIMPPMWSKEFKTEEHDVRAIGVYEHYKMMTEN